MDRQPSSLADLLAATQGRGYDLVLVFLSLPFLTPMPMLGLSTVFGLAVMLIGARLALGRKPWLPQRLLHRPIPARFFGRLLRAARAVVRVLEWFLRPRLAFLHEQFVYRRLAGAMITLAGLLLLLPLPIPFSNTLPAWTILLIAAASVARDGLCFITGAGALLVTIAFFALLALGGATALESLFRP